MQAEGGDVVAGVGDHSEPVRAEMVQHPPGELGAACPAGQ